MPIKSMWLTVNYKTRTRDSRYFMSYLLNAYCSSCQTLETDIPYEKYERHADQKIISNSDKC